MRGAGIFDKTDILEKPESLPTITNDAWDLLYALSKSDYTTVKTPREQQEAA